MSMNYSIYASSQITPGYAKFYTYGSVDAGQTEIEGGNITCSEVVSNSIKTPEGVEIGENYSTTEKRIGLYNDKPLYQKTINFGTLPNNNPKNVPHSVANVDKIWIYDGFVEGTVAPMTATYPLQLGISDMTGGVTWMFYVNGSYVSCYANGSAGNFTASVTIRYTKTTD